MRVLFKAVLGAILISLVLQPGTMWAQKGQVAKVTELAAEFRDNWDSGAQKYADKIHSDGGGLYYTDGYTSVRLGSDGRLSMEIQGTRRVFLEFDTPTRPAPIDSNGQLTCREYGRDIEFHIDPPSFLSGVPNNDILVLTTFGEIRYNGTAWVYEADPPFDFRTMEVDATARSLVRVQLNFYTAEDPAWFAFSVMPNYQLWASDSNLAGGVVQVTHPSADVWVVEPQSPDDPVTPLRSLGPNEAGFKVTAPAVKRVHAGGNCDLGDWVMPFQITLYKR